MNSSKRPKSPPQDQHANFVEAAKRLGTDDDPERFKETVKKLAKAKVEAASIEAADSQVSASSGRPAKAAGS